MTSDEMTEADRCAAASALGDWLISQNIPPLQGTLVMIKLIAGQLVSQDPMIIAKNINLISNLLMLEVFNAQQSTKGPK